MYTYTAISTDKDNDPIMYVFYWGDSPSVPSESEFLPNGTSFTVSHSWIAAGRYTVKVTVTDDNVLTERSNITVYIDALQTADLGYLIDNNGDGIYDTFYSDVLQQIMEVENKNGVYAIDSDGNGEWDYTFDRENGLVPYQQRKTPGFELIFVLCALSILLFLRRIGKKWIY
jgi:hypothetical protein